MSAPTDIWQTTAVEQSGVTSASPAGAAAEHRADILAMTQTAEGAVLRPAVPGRWSHALRAALACRIARMNGSDQLAERYLAMMDGSEFAAVADPGAQNHIQDLEACLTFTDHVATQPSDITADDINILQKAGVTDADIVRLTELNAFLAYQIRLVAGLSLLAGVSQ